MSINVGKYGNEGEGKRIFWIITDVKLNKTVLCLDSVYNSIRVPYMA